MLKLKFGMEEDIARKKIARYTKQRRYLNYAISVTLYTDYLASQFSTPIPAKKKKKKFPTPISRSIARYFFQ